MFNLFCFYFFFILSVFIIFYRVDKKDHILEQTLVQNTIPDFAQTIKRQRMTPPLNERVMLYVRQDNEDVYTPLHVVPPTTLGLLNAVSFYIKM